MFRSPMHPFDQFRHGYDYGYWRGHTWHYPGFYGYGSFGYHYPSVFHYPYWGSLQHENNFAKEQQNQSKYEKIKHDEFPLNHGYPYGQGSNSFPDYYNTTY